MRKADIKVGGIYAVVPPHHYDKTAESQYHDYGDPLQRAEVLDVNAPILQRRGFYGNGEFYDTGKRGIKVRYLDETKAGFLDDKKNPAGHEVVLKSSRGLWGTWADYRQHIADRAAAKAKAKQDAEERVVANTEVARDLNERQQEAGLVDDSGRPLFDAKVDDRSGKLYFVGQPGQSEVEKILSLIEG
jgi:hypothetical protein